MSLATTQILYEIIKGKHKFSLDICSVASTK